MLNLCDSGAIFGIYLDVVVLYGACPVRPKAVSQVMS